MTQERYLLSFTAGGLLISESLIVLNVYLEEKDWEQTQRIITDDNLLQSRTGSTTSRKFSEIKARLDTLTGQQQKLLSEGRSDEQVSLLWLAACKRYVFLKELAREIILNKYLSLDLQIESSDVERFIQSQIVWHPELEQISASTQKKIQTVSLRMLREAGILNNSLLIQPSILSPRLSHVIQSDSMEWFSIFPIAPQDIPTK